MRFDRLLIAATFATCLAPRLLAQPDTLPDGTAEATKAIAKFKAPAGFKIDLWAAEPMLGNPVAFCIDEKGRIFVAESYRFNRGTEEYRHRPFFLEGDLQNVVIEQRLFMYKQFQNKFPGGISYFTKYSEQIRLLEDRAGKGRADHSSVFADRFNAPLDGLAAGVLAKDGAVYFTCIPKLWKLRDTKGTGKADLKTALHTGFGVQTAFLGHDLHGLVFGPDGKLYFSIGDRGYNVTTHEKKSLWGPRMGAVFRCDPDGKNLEVIHTGLRNPQELAFDQFGNLFAADNNCDKGDDSRLVYVVEGGHSGWNMAYQTVESPSPSPPAPLPQGARGDYLTGPWHAEKLWHLQHPGQAAYIVPSVGKLGAGPAGFTFTSGLGWPKRYQNAFFMCNFTGNGGVDSFRVVPKGAGFEVADYHTFISPVSATDVDFGYDGKMYLSDWVQFVWDGGGVGKGRIYTVSEPKTVADPQVKAVGAFFRTDVADYGTVELLRLLKHADYRVRLRAQFGLAARGERGILAFKVALHNYRDDRLATLHALWGLGQLAPRFPQALELITLFLKHNDAELRAQAVKLLGDIGITPTTLPGPPVQKLIEGLIDDPQPRVRFFAMQTAGKLQFTDALPGILRQLAANKDEDVYLRHAGVQALVNMNASEYVLAYVKRMDAEQTWGPRTVEGKRAVRLAAVLMLRALNDQRVDDFLNDSEELIVLEAARAIHDYMPIHESMPLVAKLSERYIARAQQPDAALWRRILSAHFQIGKSENILAVLAVAQSKHVPEAMRQEALACLADWARPGKRDRVTGFWRPIEEKRDGAKVARLIEERFPALLASATGKLQADVARLAEHLKIKVDETAFTSWVADEKRPIEARAGALELLMKRKSRDWEKAFASALKSKAPELRAVARELMCDIDPVAAWPHVSAAIGSGTVMERQRAIRLLPRIKTKEAREELDAHYHWLKVGTLTETYRFDVLEAARAENAETWKQFEADKKLARTPEARLQVYDVTLHGGDAARGRQVFVSHPVAQCIRCHKTQGQGGDAGPDLSALLPKGKADRKHLLESLLYPSQKFTPGYGVAVLTLGNGKVLTGTVKSEDAGSIELMLGDGKLLSINKADIEDRANGISPMPEMGPVLSMEEIRDLIEYLATLK